MSDTTKTTKAAHELARLSRNAEVNQRALDLATAIVITYSDPSLTETCCSAQDLIADIATQFMGMMLSLENQEKNHEAWLRMAGEIERERSKNPQSNS